MTDNEVTYEIVVKKVNKKPKIVSIKKNGNLMKHKPTIVPSPNFGVEPPSIPELVDGCVGLGVAFDNRCRWLWGTWW